MYSYALGARARTLVRQSQREMVPPDSLAAVWGYIIQFPEIKDNISVLTKKAGVSVPHFCALFKFWFKCSPGQCRLNARMERACYYLKCRSHTVKEVGILVGYDDPYQFPRIFRKHMGVSPAKWLG